MQAFLSRLKGLVFKSNRPRREKVHGKWSIGIFTGTSPFDLSADDSASNPVIRAADVTDGQANFVADPFMVHEGETWYLFFEVDMIRPEGNIGKIGLASSPDGFAWTYVGIVLEAPYHLSYPYVFKHGDDYFMIPETRADRSVHLYRATDFPLRWAHAKTLLAGRRFADTSIFRHDDRWWLFTDSGNTTLRLFGAAELGGPWKEHPRSPLIRKNPSIARPGGRVVTHDGQLIRFAQDCYHHYGDKVWGFSISELTRKTYREEKCPQPVLQASGAGWNRSGMHTVDPHLLADGRWIACVDGFGDGGAR
ncbi:conserved hypothetical protein [Desulfosarcina cetonica]|nr:conserved hypothetical protein [Desulfosarcina cetonica]